MTNTSPKMLQLAEPEGDERIPLRTFGYMATTTRDDLFDLVTRKFIESGVSKKTLACRLGKDPAQVTRLLGAPGNWTVDTIAELLFAIDGSALKVEAFSPLRASRANAKFAGCLSDREARYFNTLRKSAPIQKPSGNRHHATRDDLVRISRAPASDRELAWQN